MLNGIRAQQLNGVRQILERIPTAERQKLLDGLEIFAGAVQDWWATCCLTDKKENAPNPTMIQAVNKPQLVKLQKPVRS
jgi:hypothetical protein